MPKRGPPPTPLVSVHRQSLPVVFPQSRPPEFSIECRATEAAAANRATSAIPLKLREGLATYAQQASLVVEMVEYNLK